MDKRHLLCTPLLSLLCVALPATISSAAPGLDGPRVSADDDDLPDGRDEVEALLKGLIDCNKKRGARDTDAIGFLAKLAEEFPRSGPRDRKDIVKGLDRTLNQTRRERNGQPDNALFIATAEVLGGMGPDSVKTLVKWIGNSKHEDDLVLQRVLILSLGRTQDEDAVKTLLDLLGEYQWILQGAAAEALGQFGELDQKDRKEIFGVLLKTLGSADATRQSDPNSSDARKRWDTISGPIQTTLRRLSGASESGYSNWQRWWNKNKRKDWDEEG